jgi:hypothetical protein
MREAKGRHTMETLKPPEVIRSFQDSAPGNVVELARAFGINVWESPSLPDGISGKLFKDEMHGGTQGYSIVVRAEDHIVRKRFTIAHEIGHFLLHRDRFGSQLLDDAFYRSALSTRAEAEANRMAAAILMPTHLVEHYLARGFKDPAALAAIFEVSAEAMRIRLGLQ